MSKAKYKQGKQICSIAEFDTCESLWYKWNGKTRHRAALKSLQYHTLDMTIKGGRLFTAELIEKGESRMTNQEASKVIKDGLEDMSLDFTDEEQYEALTMAIKALEQEQTGHWSRKTKVDAYDIAGVKTWGIKCQCDKCDFTTIVVEDFGYYNYCPNCGARMESEGEEC